MSYIDFGLIEKYPNKYNIQPKDIKNLKILDWNMLKKKTWLNNAMLSGSWWCHLEGCNKPGEKYDDFDEFWIGFNEDNNTIDCHFYSNDGMCGYDFKKFYDGRYIENQYDMWLQVNTIRWLNMMIDECILRNGVKRR